MTINSLPLNVSTAVSGLATQTFNVVTAGNYVIEAKYFVPYVPAGSSADSASVAGQSELEVLLKHNSDTLATIGGDAAYPTPTQPFIYGKGFASCSAGDTLTVECSSSAAVDNQLNAIKGIINVYQGV